MVQMLQQVWATSASAADAELAAVLLCGIESAPSISPLTQRATLAAAWLDDLLSEPFLPPTFAADLDALRWVFIKAAIADPGFVSPVPHPVRKLLDTLVQSATFIHFQGRSPEGVRAQLREAADHLSIRARFVLDALHSAQALEPIQAEPFFQQLAKEQALRRECLLLRLRHFVAQEIERHTLDISLSAAARTELMRSFLPLLTTLALRYGALAPSSRCALQLLERFVDSFSDGACASERQALLGTLCETLRSSCLPAAQTQGIAAEMSRLDTVQRPRRRLEFSARQLSD